MKKAALGSSFLLFLAAFIWGVAFVAQSVGMDYMGPCSFNGARFLMGSVVLMPLIIFRRGKQNTEGQKKWEKDHMGTDCQCLHRCDQRNTFCFTAFNYVVHYYVKLQKRYAGCRAVFWH